MTHLRFYTIVFALTVSMTGYAQDSNLGNPIDDQVLDAGYSSETLAYEGFNWFLSAGPSFDSNSLSGTGAGAATSLDPSTSVFYSTAFNWRSKGSATSWHLRYKHTAAEYKDVVGLTPELFKYNKDMYNLLAKFRVTSSNFYVGFGLYYYTKKLDEALSVDALVDQTFIGPTIAVGSSGKISSVFNWEADLLLNLPFIVDEPDASTGRY